MSCLLSNQCALDDKNTGWPRKNAKTLIVNYFHEHRR